LKCISEGKGEGDGARGISIVSEYGLGGALIYHDDFADLNILVTIICQRAQSHRVVENYAGNIGGCIHFYLAVLVGSKGLCEVELPSACSLVIGLEWMARGGFGLALAFHVKLFTFNPPR
jgi:hypothetical protein